MFVFRLDDADKQGLLMTDVVKETDAQAFQMRQAATRIAETARRHEAEQEGFENSQFVLSEWEFDSRCVGIQRTRGRLFVS